MPTVSKVLIANRGEIAVRIMRTLTHMGIDSVAVYSRLDAGSLHVRTSPTAVSLAEISDPADATGGYLSIDALVSIAVAQGCDAVHPGYGFLAENAQFARACSAAGLMFIGPGPAAIEALGDKAAARAIAVKAQVPVVPGIDIADDAQAVIAAQGIGFPILIKPVAGGGGKGMHIAEDAESLQELLPRARREALAAFGDDRLILERFLPRARHIEVQVLADDSGDVRAIGDRECTLQRRHQKVIEEAPAPHLSDSIRAQIHAAAEAVVREVGYTNAGTVEFVVSADDESEFYFLEVNTRLQVEHPVTEEVLGIDLVSCQVRIAKGELLTDLGLPASPHGWAFEARVYAEDADHGFLPTGGRLAVWDLPRDLPIRVDAAVEAGDSVSSSYDPMIAKVITSGTTRDEARDALVEALRRTSAFGVVTNIGFLVDLLNADEVRSGLMDTRFIERFAPGRASRSVEPLAVVAWAVGRGESARQAASRTPVSAAWRAADSWRLSDPRAAVWRGHINGADVIAMVKQQPETDTDECRVDVTVAGAESAHLVSRVQVHGHRCSARIDGADVVWDMAQIADPDGMHWWLRLDGITWVFDPPKALRGAGPAGSADSVVRSPMPGTVVRLNVSVGDSVDAGAHLLSVEAMKMEHALTAPHAGVVSKIACDVGAHVKLRDVLVVVEPHS